MEDVVHYTCEIGLAGISSDACNNVYCTSKEELIAEFKTSDDEEEESEEEPNSFKKKLTPSKELAAIIGDEPLARTEVINKLWGYIKENKLQDPNDSQTINTDAKLEKLFGGKKQVKILEMTPFITQNLS